MMNIHTFGGITKNAAFAIIAAAVAIASYAVAGTAGAAGTTTDNNTTTGNSGILNSAGNGSISAFNRTGLSAGILSENKDLAQLFILAELFSDSEIRSGTNSDLSRLILLSELFRENGNILGGSNGLFQGNGNNLSDLFILELFVSGEGSLSADSGLAELFILSEITGSADGTSFSGSGNSLVEFFILSELFNDN